MVEDNIDHCLDLANHEVKTYLLERPWNRNNNQEHPLIKKVNGWNDIISHLENN